MTVIVVDASLNLHRAKNVMLSNARKNPEQMEDIFNVNYMAGVFFSMLPVTLDQFRATKCYILWDKGRCSYRVALNDAYKVARNEVKKDELSQRADDLFAQCLMYLHERMPKIGVASILVPGVEADDIAYYISHTQESGVLVSDDQDWFLNLNENWKLYRSMQKTASKYSLVNGENLFDWKDFTKLMKGDNVSCESTAREIYLLQKALVGDKDEIPRITTEAPAKRIARYLSKLTDDILPKDQIVLDASKDLIDRNIKLADTSWLINDASIVDMVQVIDVAHQAVSSDTMTNFFEFAIENNCLTYHERWTRISKLLNYNH